MRRSTAVFVVSVVLVGCSGSKADDGTSTAEGGEPAAGSSATTAPKDEKASASKRSSKQGATATTSAPVKGAGPKAAADGANGSQGSKAAEEVDTTTLKMDISITLAEKCVRPGGAQTITVHAPPTSAAGYDTYYADGKAGLHEGFHGGNMVGWTDETGTWTHTWVVAGTAPPGQATVVVSAIHDEYGRGETGDLFVVADPLGLCDPPKYANE